MMMDMLFRWWSFCYDDRFFNSLYWKYIDEFIFTIFLHSPLSVRFFLYPRFLHRFFSTLRILRWGLTENMNFPPKLCIFLPYFHRQCLHKLSGRLHFRIPRLRPSNKGQVDDKEHFFATQFSLLHRTNLLWYYFSPNLVPIPRLRKMRYYLSVYFSYWFCGFWNIFHEALIVSLFPFALK